MIDNAKVIMILLVVFGHLIEPIINNSNVLKLAWVSIYSFHMPVFIMLAGMVSHTLFTKEKTYKLNSSILVPLLIFTIIYELFDFLTIGEFSHYTYNLQPYWILWFLYSLFIWKLVLPVFLGLRYPLTTSIIISIGAGHFENIGYSLGVSRTIYFFPFFIIGFYLTHYDLLQRKTLNFHKIVYLSILVLNVLFFWLLIDKSNKWLLGSLSYNNLEVDGLEGSLIRVILYFVSIITSISVLKLIPNVKLTISSLGAKSLYVFLWHGFFVKIILGIGLLRSIGEIGHFPAMTLLFLIAIAITWLLSINLISNLTDKMLFKPFSNLILKKPSN
jgi:fucose 4-O-acetylase-like acetyltransferase